MLLRERTRARPRHSRLRWGSLVAVGMLLMPALAWCPGLRGSDHADTAENYNRIGSDLTDVFIFPSPQNADNVVLVMDANGLIPTGQARRVTFDPRVLYQFRIDTSGDFVEDLVIQARFGARGPRQSVTIAGPARPDLAGTVSSLLPRRQPRTGVINRPFTAGPGITVFAGAREDPFFFDLERFYQLLPDRMTPLTGQQVNLAAPNVPTGTSWREPGAARDFFADLNVLSIIVELPRAALGGGVIRVWTTTSIATVQRRYTQQDRLARPIVNELLAPVSNRRHELNNKATPRDDDNFLADDIEAFLTVPAGRSRATKDVIESVLVPDVMVADLSRPGPASYLGVETNGATGGRFGGRALTDDVLDISAGVVFGDTIAHLGLAPDDGQEIPTLTSDHVGPDAKHFTTTFPYLGAPR